MELGLYYINGVENLVIYTLGHPKFINVKEKFKFVIHRIDSQG